MTKFPSWSQSLITSNTWMIFVWPFSMRHCALLAFEHMSKPCINEVLKKCSFVPSKCASSPSLSPWVHEWTMKAWRSKKSPLQPFGVCHCSLDGFLHFLECTSTLQSSKWPLIFLHPLKVHPPSLHAYFLMHASDFVLSLIYFHDELHSMALCTCFMRFYFLVRLHKANLVIMSVMPQIGVWAISIVSLSSFVGAMPPRKVAYK